MLVLTVLGMSWWGWLLVLLCIAITLFAMWTMSEMGQALRRIRTEYMLLIKDYHPNLRVISEDVNHLEIELPNADNPSEPFKAKIPFLPIYQAVAPVQRMGRDMRRVVLKQFAELDAIKRIAEATDRRRSWFCERMNRYCEPYADIAIASRSLTKSNSHTSSIESTT